jgi:fructan beta-fructosidase
MLLYLIAATVCGFAPTSPGHRQHELHAARVQAPPSRPVLHFTPEKNWINDPNGLIWLDGEYHLFYQHNPFGDQWGHMSWGHAVSRDALAWEHLPIAIPEADGVMAFSGTAVLDRENTSGFGKDGSPALVAVYTGHEANAKRQHQNLAFSADRGRTWTKYAGNPVLDLGEENFRDPKVFWHAPTGRWIMAVALAAEKKALFYASPDLKKWTRLSAFGAQGQRDVPNWECPDLFELPVEGEPGGTRWVLVVSVGGNGPTGGAGCQYFVGRFDGEQFVNDNPAETVLWLDHGMDFYAFQSFADAPGGKRIGLAWMANPHYAGETPTTPWRGSMTIPREFGLVRTAAGIRMTQKPMDGVRELLMERGAKETVLEAREISEGITPAGVARDVAVIEAVYEVGSAERFGLRVRDSGREHTAVGYDVRSGEMYIDRHASGRIGLHPRFPGRHAAAVSLGEGKRVTLTMVLDRGSVEAFGNEGLAAVTSLIFPETDARAVSFFAEKGTVKLVRLRVVGLGGE